MRMKDDRTYQLRKRAERLKLMDPNNRIPETERTQIVLQEDDGQVGCFVWFIARLNVLERSLRRAAWWLWRNTWGRI